MVLYRSILYIAIFEVACIGGFVIVPPSIDRSKTFGRVHATTRIAEQQEGEWVSLADGVKKRILQEGDGEVAQKGSEVEVDYVGTLKGEKDWTVEDVVDCWLTRQQGLDHLADAFVKVKIDGSKLMDPKFFTEEFVAEELGVSNKIQCKKIVMAAKRMAKQQDEYAVGTEFDSSKERGPFKFTLGQGKTIQAYELAVATMKEGERAEVICRSDYAYDKDGLRRGNGDVVVPPFATLCFVIDLLKC